MWIAGMGLALPCYRTEPGAVRLRGLVVQTSKLRNEEMLRTLIVMAMAAAVGFAGVMTAQAEDSRYGKQKVVYHINYPGGDGGKKYYGALRNIQNHINAVGKDNLEVKVVMHGNGLGLLMQAKDDLKLQGNVSNLKGQNVGFNVCSNTLRGRKIDKDKDLFEVFEEDIVPSGVAEVSRLQGMGYTYIKP